MKINKLILLLSFILCLSGCNMKTQSKHEKIEYSDLEYSENIETITHYFRELQTVKHVYFKSESEGSNGLIGPSSFRIAGFIVISEDEKNTIFESFDFVPDKPDFPDGISPDITGKTEFSWHTSYDFSRKYLKGNFIGKISLDSLNSIIYIDVVNA